MLDNKSDPQWHIIEINMQMAIKRSKLFPKM